VKLTDGELNVEPNVLVDDDIFHRCWTTTSVSGASCWVLLRFCRWPRHNFAICHVTKYEFVKLILF